MAQIRGPLEAIERLPTMIVAGTRFLAKELADGHGLEQGQWMYCGAVTALRSFKTEEIMFGRGCEKLPEIKEIVEVSKRFGLKVVFGDYPKLTAEEPVEARTSVPEIDKRAVAPPPAEDAKPTVEPTPPPESARRDMRRRENKAVRGGDEIKTVINEIAAMETKYEALLRKLIIVAERKLAVLEGARAEDGE